VVLVFLDPVPQGRGMWILVGRQAQGLNDSVERAQGRWGYDNVWLSEAWISSAFRHPPYPLIEIEIDARFNFTGIPAGPHSANTGVFASLYPCSTYFTSIRVIDTPATTWGTPKISWLASSSTSGEKGVRLLRRHFKLAAMSCWFVSGMRTVTLSKS